MTQIPHLFPPSHNIIVVRTNDCALKDLPRQQGRPSRKGKGNHTAKMVLEIMYPERHIGCNQNAHAIQDEGKVELQRHT